LNSKKISSTGTIIAGFVFTGIAPLFAAGASALPGDARSTAEEAYIYGYAPVYMERQRRNMVSVDKDSECAHWAGRRHIGLSSVCRAKSRPWK
jgi:hypothetical protein